MSISLQHPTLAFGAPTGPDFMILAVLILVLFGARKLPRFGRGLGQSMGEFRKAKEEFERELREASNQEPMPDEGKEDPHARVNLVISIIFFLSLALLIISIVRQVMAQP